MGAPFDLAAIDEEEPRGGFDLSAVDLGDQADAAPDVKSTTGGGDGTPANGDDSMLDSLLTGGMDFGKGLVDGLTLNNAAELGNIGQYLGRKAYDGVEAIGDTQLFRDELSGDQPLERNVASTGDDDLDAMYDAANKTGAGAAGHLLGSVNTAIAGSAVPGIGGQAAMGALQGGLTAGGVSDYDPFATIGGAILGGGAGAAGGILREGAKGVGNFLGRGTSTVTGYNGAEPILETVTNADRLLKGARGSIDDAVVGIAEGSINPAREAALIAGTKGAQQFAKHADLYPKLTSVGGSAAGTGAGVLGAMFGSKAHAQDTPLQVDIGEAEMLDSLAGEDAGVEIGDATMNPTPQEYGENYQRLMGESAQLKGANRATDTGDLPWNETTLRRPDDPLADIAFNEVTLRKPGDAPVESDWTEAVLRKPGDPIADIGEASIKAYAGLPSLTYSIHQVLSSGDSGLPQEAEDQLTKAAMSGDQDRVRTVNFKLQQRYPEYEMRVQEQLDALNASQE
jgi:hypothetical protein